MPESRNPLAPKREIKLSTEDVEIVANSIAELDQSSLNRDDLFETFSDWQSKRTLTAKRIFMSTSLLVVAASWIGVDFSELTVFGLKVSNGSPDRFIIFVLIAVVLSGVFYELSRRIDSSVRKAKIIRAARDIKYLKESVEAVDEVIKRNEIKSFGDLYYDFNSRLLSGGQHDAVDVYKAIHFYLNHLSAAGFQLNMVSIAEQIVIYVLALHAVAALVLALH